MKKLLMLLLIAIIIFTFTIESQDLKKVYEPNPNVVISQENVLKENEIFFDIYYEKGKSMITRKVIPVLEFHNDETNTKYDINIQIKNKNRKKVKNMNDTVKINNLTHHNESYYWTNLFKLEPGSYELSINVLHNNNSYKKTKKIIVKDYNSKKLILETRLAQFAKSAKKIIPGITAMNGYNFYPAIDKKIDKSKKEQIVLPLYIYGLKQDVRYKESKYKLSYRLVHLKSGKQLLKTETEPKKGKTGAFDTFILKTEKIIPAIYELKIKLFDIKGDRTVEKKLTFEIVESKDNKKSE